MHGTSSLRRSAELREQLRCSGQRESSMRFPGRPDGPFQFSGGGEGYNRLEIKKKQTFLLAQGAARPTVSPTNRIKRLWRKTIFIKIN